MTSFFQKTFGLYSVALATLMISQVAFAAQSENCAKLEESSLVKTVCVGDFVRNRADSEEAPVISGSVVQIEPAIGKDGAPMSILSINSNRGLVKMTSLGFVFIQSGKCVEKTSQIAPVCIGERFKSERDGILYTVVGIAVGDGSYSGGPGILAQSTGRSRPRDFDVYSIYESRKVAITGKLSRSGSCDSEIPYLHLMGYGSLPKCATNEAITSLKNDCNTYCGGKGQVDKRDVMAKLAPTCDVSPNMFPPHKKVCTVSIEARCGCVN